MRTSAIPSIVAALLLASCQLEHDTQSLRTDAVELVAHNLIDVLVETGGACPTAIGHIVVTNHRDEIGTFILSSDHARVVLGASGGEHSVVSVEIDPRGRIDIPVSVTCGPAERLDGAFEFELSYQSGVAASGSFAVSGEVR